MSAPEDPEVVRLVDALDDLARFLSAHREPRWAEWVMKDAEWVRRGDGYGVTHFLSAFGGMGSITDLWVDQVDGKTLTRAEVVTANATLATLRERAFQLANRLRGAAQE
jgi:hypothetical protein